ncbi:MAG: lysophospholipid acyltransferase family protein [Verrucomicrobiota bacterium]
MKAAEGTLLKDGGTDSSMWYDFAATMETALIAAWRAFAVLFFSSIALTEIILTVPFVAGSKRLRVRAAWLHRWCRFACRVLGICATAHGSMPSSGLLVCNHLSYLDIIVLSSIQPCVFVAKRDVAAWPLFGWLARAAGAIFVDRRRRVAAGQVIDCMSKAIAGGSLVVLFPEGTSSDGSTVLPFKPALLEPALQLNCPIAAGAIDYSLPLGSVADEVCYWRDMTLVPHLLNLFAKARVESTLRFARVERSSPGDRKELARELRRAIIHLRS